MKLKSEFVLEDPNVIFPCIPFQDDDTERPVETCSLETSNGNDEAFVIADTRHIKRRSERKIVPMLCKGDLDFFLLLSCDTGTPASPVTR